MSSSSIRVPDRGDVIWLDFDPQMGHEQWGRRPALVLSRAAYNGTTGLAMVCPITNRAKGYAFEVLIPHSSAVTGVVLCDQVKSLDWKTRNASWIGQLTEKLVLEVILQINMLMK